MRFNGTVTTRKEDTTNLAGGKSFKQSDKLEFVSLLLTSFLADSHYRTGSATMNRIVQLTKVLPPYFCAQAALYARKVFGMRSVSHVVAGELCKKVSGETWMKDFLYGVINRPDDILEITSYYFADGNTKVTNAMRTGFGRKIAQFDRYQLAKYKNEGKEVSMVDAVNLYHPKGKNKETKKALKDLMTGKLKSENTWESKLSAAGKAGDTAEEVEELKAEAWVELLENDDLPYLAMIRNLRNILTHCDEEILPKLCKAISNPKLIAKAKVFPFQFQTAFEVILALSDTPNKVIAALSKAVDIAMKNVPVFDGKTLVVMDSSGSMKETAISGNKGTTMCSDIAALFSAVLVRSAEDADFMTFDSDARYVSLNTNDSIMGISQWIKQNIKGGSTDFRTIFNRAAKKYDRIIILSDMQGWVGGHSPSREFKEYCIRYKAKPLVYSFDLHNYGNMQFPEEKVFCLAGWSDKVFDSMKYLEEDRNVLVNTIEQIVI